MYKINESEVLVTLRVVNQLKCKTKLKFLKKTAGENYGLEDNSYTLYC